MSKWKNEGTVDVTFKKKLGTVTYQYPEDINRFRNIHRARLTDDAMLVDEQTNFMFQNVLYWIEFIKTGKTLDAPSQPAVNENIDFWQSNLQFDMDGDLQEKSFDNEVVNVLDEKEYPRRKSYMEIIAEIQSELSSMPDTEKDQLSEKDWKDESWLSNFSSEFDADGNTWPASADEGEGSLSVHEAW